MVTPSITEGAKIPKLIYEIAVAVEKRPELFAAGDTNVNSKALEATKFLFDRAVVSESNATSHINSLLSSLKPDYGPTTRSAAKRKQSPPPPPNTFRPTPLDSLFVQGMAPEQVWEQLELRTKNICGVLDALIEREEPLDEADGDESSLEDSFEDMELDDDEEEDGEEMNSEDDEASTESEDDHEGSSNLGEKVETLRGESDSEEEEIGGIDRIDLDRPRRSKRLRRGPMHPTLDDAFFSIDEFNRQTEEMEAKSRGSGKLAEDDEDDDEAGDEDIDLFAAVEDVDDLAMSVDEDDDEQETDVNDPYYKDFFAPPPRIPLPKKKTTPNSPDKGLSKKRSVRFNENVRVKNIKAVGKGRPFNDLDQDDEEEEEEDDLEEEDQLNGFGEVDGEGEEEFDAEEDIDEDGSESDEEESEIKDGGDVIGRFKDDLFADDDDEEAETANMSTHEKRLADIAEQIKDLEAENIAPKEWTLMGEASARTRPQNSLLEEDLEFEHVAKQVPIITEEVTKSLEDTIKARIIEGRFDDVVRKRPVDDKPFLPSRLFELRDSKSEKSLAQIYEEDYTTQASGEQRIDDRDGKLQKEHEEIEKQWSEICYKLDALCNAHFTPKQPKATISTISNVASTTLESALPTAVSTGTLLAPEEVFAHDVAATRSKSELTPTENKALRSKRKKFKKKQRQALDMAVDKFARKNAPGNKQPKTAKEAKDMALESLVKSGKGVTVVGKPHAGKQLGKRRKGTEGDSKTSTSLKL
ncbi:hypothetical protein FRC02_002668 [Tulasnella sp. 418]|nr:hypothetical protein FRC02_002668 [Tulasnella sp. 418]